MWLIVGLGNPGREYQFTRHNIGFRVIDRLAFTWSIPLGRKSMRARWAKGHWEGQEVVLVKPQTFMNLSGEAVAWMVARFGVPVSKLIVVHDDLDFPLGEIRVRKAGGDGGHRGVKSIIERLGQREFVRVRMGIGRPDRKGVESNYVLETFSDQEKEVLVGHLQRGVEAVSCIVSKGAAVAMNEFNRRKPETVLAERCTRTW